jgi:alkylglycerol monooxygenase
MSKIIVFATPVFFLLIALEFAWSRRPAARVPGPRAYRLNDAINSLSLGVLSQVAGVLSKVLTVGIYAAVFHAVALFPDQAFWSTWYGVVLALVFYDFCYYWLHRAGHTVALFWAAHVVHHQSQHYNLSTALRQTSSGTLFGWVFYLPMAVAGVPPVVFGIVALIDLLYQFWVHTEQVGTLGWFDRVFCSPSNHRVHHAVNDPYIDKNYGGILMLWDHWFGTFREETEPCVYGTRGALNSWDPLWANAEVYCGLARDSWATRRWVDKLRIWVMPPGWQPADLAAAHPKPAFRLEQVQTFNPPLSAAQQWFASLQFMVVLGAVAAFLWVADDLAFTDAAMVAAGLSASVWAAGRFMQQGLSMLEVLAVDAAAWASLSAVGLLPGHMLAKPLVLLLAIAWVLLRASRNRSTTPVKCTALLLAALVFSLAGDVFLMLPGDYFIPGLAAFLVVHGFYIALFRQDAPWFGSRRALLCVLAIGATVYAVLWNHLPDTGLQIAVAAYVTVICLMTSQALGRASVRGDSATRWAGIAACIFMSSDALIALNKFLVPVPLASFWILTTYYAAQLLLTHHSAHTQAKPESPISLYTAGS